MTILRNILFLCLVAWLPACGGPNTGRQTVYGTVNYNGQPVVYGTISFDPDAAQGGRGPQGSAEIQKGSYQTSSDLGPMEGPQIVRVTTWGTSPTDRMLGEPLVSEFTTSYVVPPGGGKFDIDIPVQRTSQPKR